MNSRQLYLEKTISLFLTLIIYNLMRMSKEKEEEGNRWSCIALETIQELDPELKR
jgi:hypothetical protein